SVTDSRHCWCGFAAIGVTIADATGAKTLPRRPQSGRSSPEAGSGGRWKPWSSTTSQWLGSPPGWAWPGEVLPGAVAVMDPFHVVRLAGDALDDCRRRIQQKLHKRRGRKDDPLYKSRRTLHTGTKLLTE